MNGCAPEIGAVCFDAFGTLVRIGAKQRSYVRLLNLAGREQRVALKRRLLRAPMSLDACLAAVGAPINGDAARLVREDLRAECASVTLRPGISEIWRRLRAADLKIGVCSNLAAPFGRPVLSVLPDRPDAVVFSYDVGVAKPEPEIYRLAARRLGFAPAQILFCGDRLAADIEGPRAAGMSAVLIADFEAGAASGRLAGADR